MTKVKRVNLRLTEEEWNRLESLWDKALKRSRTYGTLSDVIKEAIGLIPPNLLTEDEIFSLHDLSKHGPYLPKRKEKAQ